MKSNDMDGQQWNNNVIFIKQRHDRDEKTISDRNFPLSLLHLYGIILFILALFCGIIWRVYVVDVRKITDQDTFIWKYLVILCGSLMFLQVLFMYIAKVKSLSIANLRHSRNGRAFGIISLLGPLILQINAFAGFDLFLSIQNSSDSVFFKMNEVDLSQFFPVQLQYLGFLLCAILIWIILCFAFKKIVIKLIETGGHVVIFGVGVIVIWLLSCLTQYIWYRIYHGYHEIFGGSLLMQVTACLLAVLFTAFWCIKQSNIAEEK